MNTVLSQMLAELRALRASFDEMRREQRHESCAEFISAKKAAQMLGVKTSRLRQIVSAYEADGERIRAGRNRYKMSKIKTIAGLRS